MRKQAQPALFLGVIAAALLVAAAALLRSGQVTLTLSPETPAWLVIGGAMAASAVAILIARTTRLAAHVRAAMPSHRSTPETLDDLAELAELARTHGLLVVAADPRAKRLPLLLAGLHLLCEDADRRLLRSALEGQAESQATRTAASRGAIIMLCRAASLLGAAGLLFALFRTSLGAAAPWNLPDEEASLVLAGVSAFALATALAAPSILLLRRRTAVEELTDAAVIEAVLAMHANEDRQSVGRRLHALLPSAAERREIPDLAARQAA